MAGTILLVTSADIAGLKQTQVTLQTLQGLVGMSVDRICLVVYGYDRSRQAGQYTATDIEAELGVPVVAVLPYDHVAEQRAVSAQQPLVFDNRSKSGRALVDLAQRIHGGKIVLPPDVARPRRRWKVAPASWGILTRRKSHPVTPTTREAGPVPFSNRAREVVASEEAVGRRGNLEEGASLNVGQEEEEVRPCAGVDTACDPYSLESRPYVDRTSDEKELFSFTGPRGSGETVRLVLNASPVNTKARKKVVRASADPLRQHEHRQEENTMPMSPISPSDSQAPGRTRLPRTRTRRRTAAKTDGLHGAVEATECVPEAAGKGVAAGNGTESGNQGVDLPPYSPEASEARPIRSNGSRRGVDHSALSRTETFPTNGAAVGHQVHLATGEAQMPLPRTAQPDLHPDLRAYTPGASRSALQRAAHWLRTRSAAARLEDEHDARIQELNAQLSVGTHIIPFISSKGGVGKSTTSLTLGLALSQVEGAGPKLCEVNPDFANIAQLLGNAPKGRTIEQLLEHVPEVERGGYTALREYLTQWGRLDILLAPSRPEVMEQMSPESYRQAIDVLCWYSSWILLDCGTAPTQPLNHYAISRAHHVVFMSRPENATMAPTLTAVEYVAGLRRPEDKLRALRETTLVVNDVTGRDPVDVAKVRAALPEVNVQVLPHSDRLRTLLDDGTLDMHNMPVAYRRAVKALLASIMERLQEASESGLSTHGYEVVAGRELHQ
jgi:MinD-like ATPase involved in chromosome partitioning or flagellar assembly